jgi:hypothetical protein
MKKIFLLKIMLWGILFTLPLIAKANNLTGKYRCTEYSKRNLSSILIIQKNPSVYKFHWSYPDNTYVDGEGILQNHKIAVIYADPEKALRYGVEFFEIDEENNTLKGIFSYYDSEEKGMESCQKIVTE